MSRLAKWVSEQLAENTESEIAAGLTNGDIQTPEWLGTSTIDSNTIRIWDQEDGSQFVGFVDLSSAEAE